MTKLKRKKNRGYVTISNTPFKDKELSLKAKGLLSVIMTLPNDWNFTIAGIAGCLKERTSAISAAIKELMAAGYCVRTLEYDDSHKIAGYSYTFSDEKDLLKDEEKEEKTSEEKPSEENPSTENPSTEVPSTGNRPNINKINNKIKINKEKDTNVSKKPLSDNWTDEERAFYEGMDKYYPFVAKMTFPLLYQDYVLLLSKYSQKKIHAILRRMNNWKELNKKRWYAKEVLEDWLADDKKEY